MKQLISVQAFGKVDWITPDLKEAGLFLRDNKGNNIRCIIAGDEISELAEKGLLLKGCFITAYGELSGRSFHRKNAPNPEGEVVCIANKVVVEPVANGRVRGAVYANVKGVAKIWDSKDVILKTFIKSFGTKEAELPVSIFMNTWVNQLADGKLLFLKSLAVGREFTCSGSVSVSAFKDKNQEIRTSIQITPLDFRLQR